MSSILVPVRKYLSSAPAKGLLPPTPSDAVAPSEVENSVTIPGGLGSGFGAEARIAILLLRIMLKRGFSRQASRTTKSAPSVIFPTELYTNELTSTESFKNKVARGFPARRRAASLILGAASMPNR